MQLYACHSDVNHLKQNRNICYIVSCNTLYDALQIEKAKFPRKTNSLAYTNVMRKKSLLMAVRSIEILFKWIKKVI